ncbi:MAG: CPBP family intramembrane metalloprotease [bacterium]|nr:CPBP family intramembrane metalloprotease [bacterium]
MTSQRQIESVDSSDIATASDSGDPFSRRFFFIVPWTVPIVVAGLTYLFRAGGMQPGSIWVPLLIIYWTTIWSYTLYYRRRRGGVFNRERFRLSLKLRGDHLFLQYLLVYGPLIWTVPLWATNYLPHLTTNMALAILVASLINGPSEEIYWRACLDDAGKAAGVSERRRLTLAPIMFAFWHTAFVIHLFPLDKNWIFAWGAVLLATWISGTIWLWVMHRSGRLVPQCVYHGCTNFFSVFPAVTITVLHLMF